MTQTALEGLYYIRAARTALGGDPGPDLPEPNAALTPGDRVVIDGREYHAYQQPADATPYYYPGGVAGGQQIPGGWYSQPWWKTALVGDGPGFEDRLLRFSGWLALPGDDGVEDDALRDAT